MSKVLSVLNKTGKYFQSEGLKIIKKKIRKKEYKTFIAGNPFTTIKTPE